LQLWTYKRNEQIAISGASRIQIVSLSLLELTAVIVFINMILQIYQQATILGFLIMHNLTVAPAAIEVMARWVYEPRLRRYMRYLPSHSRDRVQKKHELLTQPARNKTGLFVGSIEDGIDSWGPGVFIIEAGREARVVLGTPAKASYVINSPAYCGTFTCIDITASMGLGQYILF
jgi:hypothetical protein